MKAPKGTGVALVFLAIIGFMVLLMTGANKFDAEVEEKCKKAGFEGRVAHRYAYPLICFRKDGAVFVLPEEDKGDG